MHAVYLNRDENPTGTESQVFRRTFHLEASEIASYITNPANAKSENEYYANRRTRGYLDFYPIRLKVKRKETDL